MIVAERLQAFKLQVTTLQLPLVVLLEKQRPDQPHDRRFVREDARDVGSALDLGVKPLERIGAVGSSGVPGRRPRTCPSARRSSGSAPEVDRRTHAF
jgi:hypothetical protein